MKRIPANPFSTSASRGRLRRRGGHLLFLSVLLFTLARSPLGAQSSETTLRLQTRGRNPALIVGFLAADELGFYAEAGLALEFVEPRPHDALARNRLAPLREGRVDLVVGGTEVLVRNAAEVELVAVFTVLQTSPARLFVKNEREILGAADLPRLRLIQPRAGSRLAVETAAMLAVNGINPDEMTYVQGQMGTGALAQVLSDDIDGFPGSLAATRYIMSAMGVKLSQVEPSAYGLDFYGDTVFASRRLAQEQPELLEHFVTASRRGWNYVFENPDEAVALLMDRSELPAVVPEMVDEAQFLHWQIEKMERLAGWPIVELGTSSLVRWRRIESALAELGLVQGSLVGEGFVFDPERLALEQQRLALQRLIIGAGAALAVVLFAGLGLVLVTRVRLQRDVRDLFEGMLNGVGVVRPRRGQLQFVAWNGRLRDIADTVVGTELAAPRTADLHPAKLLESLGLEAAEHELLAVLERRLVIQRDVKAPGQETHYALSVFPLRRKALGIAISNVTASYAVSGALEELVHQRTVTLREIHHRVRNNMQIISSMMQLQANRHTAPEVRRLNEDTQQQIRAISLAHELLYDTFPAQIIDLDEYLQRVAHEAIEPLMSSEPRVAMPRIEL